MHYRGTFCLGLLATALLATASSAQVVDFGKYPAFKGQWGRPAGNPNNWLLLAGPPPYTPEYQQKYAAIQDDLKNGGTRKLALHLLHPAGNAGNDESL